MRTRSTPPSASASKPASIQSDVPSPSALIVAPQVVIRHRIAKWCLHAIRYRITRMTRSQVADPSNKSRQSGQETVMDRNGQVALLKRLLRYVETRTTALAPAPWCNEVAVYADPRHLARE